MGIFFLISHYMFCSYKAMYEADISLSVYKDHHIFWQKILLFCVGIYSEKIDICSFRNQLFVCKTLRIFQKLLSCDLKIK